MPSNLFRRATLGDKRSAKKNGNIIDPAGIKQLFGRRLASYNKKANKNSILF